MSYLEDFRQRIQHHDYTGFLRLWEEYCYSDEFSHEDLKKILVEAKNSEIGPAFGKHVEKGLSLWRKITDQKYIHEILKLILDIQTTNSDSLGEVAYNYLKNRYPEDPLFIDKLKMIGLRPGGEFQHAISYFELLSHLQKGNFVYHTGGWGTCEIMDVSRIREEVSLECDLVLGIKHLSYANAMKNLYPLTKDHFLSRRFGNPALLEKEALEDPLRVIHQLLKDLGSRTAAEIKEELCDLVVPAESWNRWWQNTRAKIKKDTKISSPKDMKEPFFLREEELTHEAAFYNTLEEKLTEEELITMIYNFIRDFPETLKNQDFKSSLEAKLQAILTETPALSESKKIEIYFLLEDVANLKKYREILQNATAVQELIKDIAIVALKKRALIAIKELRNDWEKLFLDLLFTVGQNTLRDYIFSELLPTSKLLQDKLKELLSHAITYPDVFLWYFQKIIDKKNLPFADREGKSRFFESFLILLDHLSHKSEFKDLVKRMVSLITNDRYKMIRDVFKQTTVPEVQEFLLLFTKCTPLTDHDIKIIYSLAEVAHPTLAQGQKKKWQEEILWATEESYLKAKKRIEQIATIETVQNAKEIEEARALGDLRENAEFKSALEKRDRLQAELQFLSNQINKARILTSKDIQTDVVSIGTVVECAAPNGKKVKFTLLGPWDADPEKNIVSLQSKLAQAMLGKAVGEKFHFQNEEYLIMTIRSYFGERK